MIKREISEEIYIYIFFFGKGREKEKCVYGLPVPPFALPPSTITYSEPSQNNSLIILPPPVCSLAAMEICFSPLQVTTALLNATGSEEITSSQ